MMIVEPMEDVEERIRVGRELLKDLKFADDQGMITQSESELQTIMDAPSKTRKKYEVKINVEKTKFMRVCIDGIKREQDNAVNITVYGQAVEKMNQFRHLGSIISDDGACTDIKSRIAKKRCQRKAKNEFN